jgi:hypothetical protein
MSSPKSSLPEPSFGSLTPAPVAASDLPLPPQHLLPPGGALHGLFEEVRLLRVLVAERR